MQRESDIHKKLVGVCVSKQERVKFDYPRPVSREQNQRMPPIVKATGRKQILRKNFTGSFICDRCWKHFKVRKDGQPMGGIECTYHPGPISSGNCTRCNKKRRTNPGCVTNKFHVHRGEQLLANYTGYVKTQPKVKGPSDTLMVCALDCEMAYTTHGLELIRVTLVDFKGEVKYNERVKPSNQVLDYNTEISGIEEADLRHVAKSLEDAQQELLKFITDKTIIIGHSLEHDMKALKIFHTQFIDTSLLYRDKSGGRRSLKKVVLDELLLDIQQDTAHDSEEDALAAICLALKKSLKLGRLSPGGSLKEIIMNLIMTDIS